MIWLKIMLLCPDFEFEYTHKMAGLEFRELQAFYRCEQEQARLENITGCPHCKTRTTM